MKTLKSACGVVSIIVSMVSTTPVLATTTGAQALGTAATTLDIWKFECPEGATSARANVKDLAETDNIPARMRVMLLKDGKAAQAEDLKPAQTAGEGGGSSPDAVLAQGAGLYLMLFFKSFLHTLTSGVESYEGSVICSTEQGAFDPVLTQTQNQ